MLTAPMKKDIAIRAEGLGKKYVIGRQKSGDFRNAFANRIRSLFGRNESSAKEEFWALQDISFEIKEGEAIGVIGRNGAGKSTLLKILSRITEPTRGRFEINGRVSSLLEVGTGFHMELTGRENIYLNGTILGMRRTEIKQKLDEIIAFSGVEQFLDTPVKHYSSGMKVRLAFSVAAHLEPEVLIIDEVLAVGDAEFQKKCLGKMEEVSKKEGRTVLFVSHNMAAVEELCGKGILLENGRIVKIGASGDVVNSYITGAAEGQRSDLTTMPSAGNKKVTFKRMEVFLDGVSCKIDNGYFKIPFFSSVKFLLYLDKVEFFNKPVFFAITIRDINRVKVATLDNLFSDSGISIHNEVMHIECVCESLPLNPGCYTIDLWCSDGYETFQKIESAYSVEIVESNYYSTGKMQSKEKHGYVNLKNRWNSLILEQ